MLPDITAESHITSTMTSTTMENSHTPSLVSPPHTKTPTTVTGKRDQLHAQVVNGLERAGSEPLDPNALSKRLKEMEDAGQVRERTPGASPSRKRQRIYGDRLVESLTWSLQKLLSGGELGCAVVHYGLGLIGYHTIGTFTETSLRLVA